MQNENKVIKESIMFLEKAPYKERKQYLKDYYTNGANINGYKIQCDTWCWLIWKPTNSEENPEYKGEPLVKVVPRNIDLNKINIVLNVQPWIYI